MPVSVLTLHAMRSLLEKAIDLLQQLIGLIDHCIASEQSIAPEVGIPTTAPGRRGPEIRHYCVWVFPRGAPGEPGIYSGEMPEVWNTILKEAGLRSISGALKLRKYDIRQKCRECWSVDMPPEVRNVAPAEPQVFKFYSHGDPSGDSSGE